MKSEDQEKYNKIQKTLWAMVARQGGNMLESSGWLHSNDKSPFSAEEMDDFSDNVFLKLKSALPDLENRTVLEIGAGSGIILQKIAPHVRRYDAVDIDDAILDACKRYLPDELAGKVRFYKLFAHETDMLDDRYDIIVMNSVIQYFADLSYLEDVISKCKKNLTPMGVLFLGDVMDADLKDEMTAFVSERSSDTRRQNHDKMKYYSREYFFALSERMGWTECSVAGKIYTIRNELSLFRFDVILRN
jgi:2-polyprenyl-3-methyl-5-hydroxy-6-metoxy-1,4-benzoquinol methylase